MIRRVVPFPPSIARLLTAAAIISCLFAAEASPPESKSARDTISPAVADAMERDPGKRVILWVFFTDKGFRSDLKAEREAIALLPDPRQQLDRRPARRYAPQELDLPVYEDYVRAVSAQGAAIRQQSRWLNGVSVQTALSSVPSISHLPFVKRIQFVAQGRRWNPDVSEVLQPQRKQSEASSPAATAQLHATEDLPDSTEYGLSFDQNNQVGIVALHRQGYTGAGVLVAMCDAGYKTNHPATVSLKVVAQRDFVFHDDNVNNEPEDAANTWDHGTITLSNLGGYDPGRLMGPAYGANFILAKTEDIRAEYPLEEDNHIAALEWADSLGADVLSASLSYFNFDGDVGYGTGDLDGETIPLTRAVDIAVSRGMVVVNSAGNNGPAPQSIKSPADANSVISVGAVDVEGKLADWSSRGPTADGRTKPEVLARGVNNAAAQAGNDGYRWVSGTSLSAPLVAGGSALLIEAHPDWDAYGVRNALIATATQAASPDNDHGYGIADFTAAAFLESPAPPRMSLLFVLLEPAVGETVIATPTFRWSRSSTREPGDIVQYSILLSPVASLQNADTVVVGADTTWVPGMGILTGQEEWYWTVLAVNRAGYVRKPFHASHVVVQGQGDVTRVSPGKVMRIIGAWPNPLGGSGVIRLELSGGSPDRSKTPVAVDIIDVSGRRVCRLWASGPQAAEGRLLWDGRDEAGRRVPGGIYFASVRTGQVRSTVKLVLIP